VDFFPFLTLNGNPAHKESMIFLATVVAFCGLSILGKMTPKFVTSKACDRVGSSQLVLDSTGSAS